MLWMPGVPVILKPVLALIELLGTIIKPFSLMIVCTLTCGWSRGFNEYNWFNVYL
jgi:hypothetical protein